ncbi:MAG: hypothetical protein CVU77_08110 [Elusimicrobia bacterium HGW-Elusimicrobia-1]|jgi:uncharacterized membrane protein|nr:MAG: hypothetical protein CVU77_08110 [Elusimicrobia bacterium HGW-Elusimicrobia-1]
MQQAHGISQKNFTRNIITGLIAMLPLWITLNVLWLLFKLVSGVFTPIVAPMFDLFLAEAESNFLSRLASFALTVGVVWSVGAIATNIAGRRLLSRLEKYFMRIPIIREIYVSVRKLTDLIFNQKTAFRRVVMIEYPRRGIYSLAFVTSEAVGEIQQKTSDDVLNVFLPSTPNPTTGFLLLVPRKDVVTLDMSVDDAVKLIITGGLITPAAPTRPDTEELKPDPDLTKSAISPGDAQQGGHT